MKRSPDENCLLTFVLVFERMKKKLETERSTLKEHQSPRWKRVLEANTIGNAKKKKEYAYNQSYVRTSAVLPDMGQTEKERGESHEWTLMFKLPV